MSWEMGFNLDLADFPTAASSLMPDQPPAKRRKVQLACSYCRARKTRCDGKRPVCSSCAKRASSEDCLYEESTLNTRKHIQALESRLAQLENGDQNKPVYYGSIPIEYERSNDAHVSRESRSGLLPPVFEASVSNTSIPSVLLQSKTQRRSGICMTSAAAMGRSEVKASDALATVSTGVHDSEILFGASSTISFIERVLLTTGGTDNLGERLRTDASSNRRKMHITAVSDIQARQTLGLELLPIRRITDSYVDSFWDVAHIIFPVLHRPTFARFYAQLWAPSNSTDAPGAMEDLTMLAILNLVLAIGCRTAEGVDLGSRASLSNEFYQRARGLVPIDALDAASLPAVQMLLLTAVYLQSTTYSSRCWNIVGLAIRVAQSLGLHLDKGGAGSKNQLEREMRRRIWYVCVTLDRLICTTLGRPAMLPNSSSVPLPLVIDDEYLMEDGEGSQPANSTCRISSFIYCIQLLDILSEVLHSFYAEDGQARTTSANQNGEKTLPNLHEMLRLDAKLDRFVEDLPSNIRLQSLLQSSEAPSNHALLQARVLHGRFSYTRLLLQRPVILHLVRSASGKEPRSTTIEQNSIAGEIALRLGQVCRSTACELISVLHQDMGSVYRSSAWWTVYFTFGAAIIIIASLFCYPEDDSSSTIKDSLTRAMEIFKYYSTEVESTSQAIQVLEGLQKRFSRDEKQDNLADANPEVPGTQEADDNIAGGSVYTFGANTGNSNSFGQAQAFDPLSEEWFSNQILNFEF